MGTNKGRHKEAMTLHGSHILLFSYIFVIVVFNISNLSVPALKELVLQADKHHRGSETAGQGFSGSSFPHHVACALHMQMFFSWFVWRLVLEPRAEGFGKTYGHMHRDDHSSSSEYIMT